MSSRLEPSEDEETEGVPLFCPFTRESLAAIEARIVEQASLRTKRDHLKGDGYPTPQHCEILEPYPALEEGKPLPRHLAQAFPPELVATPIDDLDKYYENKKTFMIVSKEKYIFRFSATDSMFLLSPFNPLRRVALCILVHPAFSFLVIATILLNCVHMAMPSSETSDFKEMIFITIYAVESCIKVIARGFILEKFSYLRDPWNQLEFIVITSGYVTVSVDLGNFSALRTIRVLIALKTIAIIPGLKAIVGTVFKDIKNRKNIVILSLFLVSVFSLLSLQMYMGILTQKCVINPDPDLNLTWEEYVSNYSVSAENWVLEDDEYILCGNASGARHCPEMSTCIEGVGPNPNYGYTTFDSFPYALFCVFRLVTQDFWESLYHMVLKSAGPWHICFFALILFWAFYIRSLILSIVAASYDVFRTKVHEEEVAKLKAMVGSATGGVTDRIACFIGKEQLIVGQEKISEDRDMKDKGSIKSENGHISNSRSKKKEKDSPVSDDFSTRKLSNVTFPDRNRQEVIKMKNLTVVSDISEGCQVEERETGKEEVEKPLLKEQCLANSLKFIDIFCIWDCCIWWVRFRNIVGLVVFDPFMQLFISLCIVVNTLFMAMEHYNMHESFARFLDYANYFFTATFTIEAGLKIIALSPRYYFCEFSHRFDFFTVVLSLLDLGLDDFQGLSILRSFRLLRIFKLAKSWPSLNTLISIMWKTMDAFKHLAFVLVIIIFIFAVIGMQLFGTAYEEKRHLFRDGIVPNWNFKDFIHSFMIVFRVLCGEWIESMWDCMLVAGFPCIPYFISTVLIGNIVVMNLFFALLLSSSGASTLSRGASDSDTEEAEKLQKAIDRCVRASNWIKRFIIQSIRGKPTNHIADQNPKLMRDEPSKDLTISEIITDGQVPTMARFSKNSTLIEVVVTDAKEIIAIKENVEDCSLTSGGKQDSDKYADNVEDTIADEYPAECCPDCFYVRFRFFKGEHSKLWVPWDNARKKSFMFVENEYFKTLIITMILINSLALTLEDIYLDYRPWLKFSLQYMDKFFTILFTSEMLIKWFAFGLKKYFTNAWCWIDFVIASISIFNLTVELAGFDDSPAFKTMRLLRALSPLRAVSRVEKIRVVVNVFVQALPVIFNVLLVCLIFWLIFAIMGVQLMNGKFFSCTDEYGWRLNASFVPNKIVCIERNFTWHNPKINFDNVLNAYLALFQVATFKGTIGIMNSAIDSTGEGQQPESEASVYMYIYFIFFTIFGTCFSLNLCIGVILDNFNEQKRKMRGALNMFMTENQKKYYKAMKKMGSKRSSAAIPRPQSKLQAVIFDLTTNKKFDNAIMIFIFLNMTLMAQDHFKATEHFVTILERLNIIFVAIFTVECMLKIFALRMYYFKEAWNVFDFIVVTLSILGIVLKDKIANYLVSPTLMRFVRIIQIGRVLRLVKGVRGIRTLLFGLAMSLPALFNICLLLLLFMFIYAIFGMSLFMNVRHRADIDQNFNFETFGSSMTLLLQLFTSAGWDSVLTALMEEEDCQYGEDGDCGSKNIAIAYLVSYLIISFFILINMYITVILENYCQAMENVQKGITEDISDMFYKIWKNFDPEGTQFIRYSALSTFLDMLEEPLKIPKPNKYIIISMDIPICENDFLFCGDILDSLTKYYFQQKRHHINEYAKLKVISREVAEYHPISSTRKRQREIYATRVIQLAWRRYKGKLVDFETRKKQQQLTGIVAKIKGHHKVVIYSRTPSPSIVQLECENIKSTNYYFQH